MSHQTIAQMSQQELDRVFENPEEYLRFLESLDSFNVSTLVQRLIQQRNPNFEKLWVVTFARYFTYMDGMVNDFWPEFAAPLYLVPNWSDEKYLPYLPVVSLIFRWKKPKIYMIDGNSVKLTNYTYDDIKYPAFSRLATVDLNKLSDLQWEMIRKYEDRLTLFANEIQDVSIITLLKEKTGREIFVYFTYDDCQNTKMVQLYKTCQHEGVIVEYEDGEFPVMFCECANLLAALELAENKLERVADVQLRLAALEKRFRH